MRAIYCNVFRTKHCQKPHIDRLYIAEETKSVKKQGSPQSMWAFSVTSDTVLSMSRYPGANSVLKSYELEALEHL